MLRCPAEATACSTGYRGPVKAASTASSATTPSIVRRCVECCRELGDYGCRCRLLVRRRLGLLRRDAVLVELPAVVPILFD